MMKKEDKVKHVYEKKKAVNIRDILTDRKWKIDSVEYNEKTGKYEFDATHEDGRKGSLKRNRQYVDNLIKELLHEKQKR